MRASRLRLESEGEEDARGLAAQIRALAPRPPDVSDSVAEILAAVRERGDAAVVELTRRFDIESAPEQLRVPAEKLEAALRELDGALREAFETAVANVTAVSDADLGGEVSVELPQGQRVVLKEVAVGRAGAYVPGGRAAYPSSVVMCCVPAKVAGVEQVAVATPPGPDGSPSASVLAACALCGVDEVYSMGGAQAIAALAFGTGSVDPVDVIAGPGNHYVQEAKRQLFGTVGIDGIAGPSELVVIADEDADSELVALDLGAQAEHGGESLLVLLSESEPLLAAVEAQVGDLSASHETITGAPLALVQVPSTAAALRLADALAPEHLELALKNAEGLATGVRGSACVFVGRSGGGAAFGDYAAGSNHVLPTGGAARFDGPLGVAQFRHRQALISLPDGATRALAPHVSSMARAEGFPVHAESAAARGSASAKRSD